MVSEVFIENFDDLNFELQEKCRRTHFYQPSVANVRIIMVNQLIVTESLRYARM